MAVEILRSGELIEPIELSLPFTETYILEVAFDFVSSVLFKDVIGKFVLAVILQIKTPCKTKANKNDR
jgi:hypothetical protein